MNGKSLLITGGTGSFGKEFVRQALEKYKKIKKLVIYSRDELKQYEMAQIFSEIKFPCIRYFIGDVRDFNRLKRAMNGIDIVIHAAALKHVPIAEYNPIEFIQTNVLGAQNIIEAALDTNVKTVIALSTDKAAAPINLYGATKLCSDKLFIAANNYAGKKITFSVVRYGNVFNSRGSVLPIFIKCKDKGYFPVTEKNMTRFNITLNEGAKLVDRVYSNAIGGEIFIPKIPSFRIIDLAKAINPKNNLKIIGMRKGEKIHEELITASDSFTTYDALDVFINLPDNDELTISKFKSKYKHFKKVPTNFSYTSGNNSDFLSINDLKKLVKEQINQN